MAAEQQDPEHLQALKDYLQRKTAAADESLPEEERAMEFHALLMTMSGNPVITLLARSLQDLLIDRWAAHRNRADHGQDFTEVHDRIARAIIDGRAAEAEELMRGHMVDFIQYEREHDPRHLQQTVSWH
jgi:DNA-binding FadR family transcriptional regulator